MISRIWFELSMRFPERTAHAMEQCTNVAGIDLAKLAGMSDVDIACEFHAGVHAKKFSTKDVRDLITRLNVHCKDRPKTRLFLNMYYFLINELHLEKDLAHCFAFGLNASPEELLRLTNDNISERLDPAFLEGWYTCRDFKTLLTQLRIHFPNRLQRSQSSTAASRANPYVV